MRLLAVNGSMMYVRDVAQSVDYYTKLGFRVLENLAPVSANLAHNGFLIHLENQTSPRDPDFIREAMVEPKGGGISLYIQVDDVDAYYEELVALGITPRTKPRDWHFANREFVIKDPDGYKIVFYQYRGAKSSTAVEKAL